MSIEYSLFECLCSMMCLLGSLKHIVRSFPLTTEGRTTLSPVIDEMNNISRSVEGFRQFKYHNVAIQDVCTHTLIFVYDFCSAIGSLLFVSVGLSIYLCGKTYIFQIPRYKLSKHNKTEYRQSYRNTSIKL